MLLNETFYETLPPFLQLFQITQWSLTDPVPQDLLDAVDKGNSRYNDQQTYEGCPFLGLNAFQRSDAQLFFGRQMETLQALTCLGDQQQTDPEHLQSTANIVYYRWLQVVGR